MSRDVEEPDSTDASPLASASIATAALAWAFEGGARAKDALKQSIWVPKHLEPRAGRTQFRSSCEGGSKGVRSYSDAL
jgi:hypothetical protein